MDQDAYAKNNVPEKGAQPGIYEHDGTSETLEVTEFTQADALVRQGWKFKKALRPAAERAAESAERQRQADVEAGLVKENDKKGNK